MSGRVFCVRSHPKCTGWADGLGRADGRGWAGFYFFDILQNHLKTGTGSSLDTGTGSSRHTAASSFNVVS